MFGKIKMMNKTEVLDELYRVWNTIDELYLRIENGIDVKENELLLKKAREIEKELNDFYGVFK